MEKSAKTRDWTIVVTYKNPNLRSTSNVMFDPIFLRSTRGEAISFARGFIAGRSYAAGTRDDYAYAISASEMIYICTIVTKQAQFTARSTESRLHAEQSAKGRMFQSEVALKVLHHEMKVEI